MSNEAELLQKEKEVSDKFIQGFKTFRTMWSNKQELLIKLQTVGIGLLEGMLEESYKESLVNIINNQMVFINYCNDNAIPSLIQILDESSSEFNISGDKKIERSISLIKNSFTLSTKHLISYKQLLETQKSLIDLDDSKRLLKSINDEDYLFNKFVSEYKKVNADVYNTLVKELGSRLERLKVQIRHSKYSKILRFLDIISPAILVGSVPFVEKVILSLSENPQIHNTDVNLSSELFLVGFVSLIIIMVREFGGFPKRI